MNNTELATIDYSKFRRVINIYGTRDSSELNERLQHGWILIIAYTSQCSITRETYPGFVIGWAEESEPPKLNKQIESEKYFSQKSPDDDTF